MAQEYGEASAITVDMEGPFGSSGVTAKAGTVTLLANAWKGAQSPYSQTVETDIASMNSIINMQPNYAQLRYLCDASIALIAENDAGVVTIHALGGAPAEDMTIQITAMEVTVV